MSSWNIFWLICVLNFEEKWVSFLKKDVTSNFSSLVSHVLLNRLTNWNNHLYLVTQAKTIISLDIRNLDIIYSQLEILTWKHRKNMIHKLYFKKVYMATKFSRYSYTAHHQVHFIADRFDFLKDEWIIFQWIMIPFPLLIGLSYCFC